MKDATWKKFLQKACENTGDNFDTLVTTLTENEMNRKFESGYGGTRGRPFTAWGEKYVYFPICYDGAEWVGYAPRNPCDEAMDHQGGG